MNGKAIELGSRVRILDRETNALGVPQKGFLGRVEAIEADAKGVVLFIRNARKPHIQGRARTSMVECLTTRPRKRA